MKATAAQEAFCSTYGGILGQVGQFPRGFQQDRFFKEKDYTRSFQFKPFYFPLVAQQKFSSSASAIQSSNFKVTITLLVLQPGVF